MSSKTVSLKGKPARSFFASLMVDTDGEKALEQCAKDSPMYRAVKVELEYRKQAKEVQS